MVQVRHFKYPLGLMTAQASGARAMAPWVPMSKWFRRGGGRPEVAPDGYIGWGTTPSAKAHWRNMGRMNSPEWFYNEDEGNVTKSCRGGTCNHHHRPHPPAPPASAARLRRGSQIGPTPCNPSRGRAGQSAPSAMPQSGLVVETLGHTCTYDPEYGPCVGNSQMRARYADACSGTKGGRPQSRVRLHKKSVLTSVWF